jgi:hypothetical protein
MGPFGQAAFLGSRQLRVFWAFPFVILRVEANLLSEEHFQFELLSANDSVFRLFGD